MNSFVFGAVEPCRAEQPFVADVPVDVKDVEAFIEALYQAIRLPVWYSFNWDALFDWLRDFEHLDQQHHTIVLRHAALPALAANDLHIYLDVLRDALESWAQRENAEHELIAVFPAESKQRVLGLLATPVHPGGDAG